MAITTKAYGIGVRHIVNNLVNWSADTVNISLHTNLYTPDQDLHDFFDDATNQLATANGYTAGGVALSGKTVTYDAATNQVRLDANDPSWTFTAPVTWRHAVVRKARGGLASADELIAYLTWDADQTVSTAYTLVLDATGLITFTAA